MPQLEKDKKAELVKEGLKLLLKKIEEELLEIDIQLNNMCKKYGVHSIEELEELFKSNNIDYPELDLAWVEYRYLIDRKKKLLEKRDEIQEQLNKLR